MLFYICISILTSHRFSFALCCYFSMKVNISQDQESSQSAAWLSNAALMWPLPDPHLSFCLSSSLSFTVQSPQQVLRFTYRLTCCGSCPLVLMPCVGKGHTYVSCVPVSVKEEREVLAPMEEKNLWFCFERVHLCCFVLVMWKRWINMHSQRDVCTVCTRVRLCVFLAGTLLWHRDSLCPLRLLRHQLVQRSSHQHDKHHPDQTRAYLLSRGQDSRAEQQKKRVHSLRTRRKRLWRRCAATPQKDGAREAPTLVYTAHYAVLVTKASTGINMKYSLVFTWLASQQANTGIKPRWWINQRHGVIYSMCLKHIWPVIFVRSHCVFHGVCVCVCNFHCRKYRSRALLQQCWHVHIIWCWQYLETGEPHTYIYTHSQQICSSFELWRMM